MISMRSATSQDVASAISNCLDVYKDGYSLRYASEINAAAITMGDKLLGVIYVSDMFPGVARLSAVLTNEIKNHPVVFIRFFKKLLQHQDTLNIHRLQIDVKVGNTIAIRMLEALGFTNEGIMKSFGSDKTDFIMYGRVL